MSALTPSAFRTRYPEFVSGTYPDPTVQAALDDCALEMDGTSWGRLFDRGAYALCAHLLSISVAGTSPIGGVKSRSIGDVSVTFIDGASATMEIGSTKYGLEYARLQKLISGGAVVV